MAWLLRKSNQYLKRLPCSKVALNDLRERILFLHPRNIASYLNQHGWGGPINGTTRKSAWSWDCFAGITSYEVLIAITRPFAHAEAEKIWRLGTREVHFFNNFESEGFNQAKHLILIELLLMLLYSVPQSPARVPCS